MFARSALSSNLWQEVFYTISILNWSIKTENRHTVFERWANAALLQETPAGFRIKGRYHSNWFALMLMVTTRWLFPELSGLRMIRPKKSESDPVGNRCGSCEKSMKIGNSSTPSVESIHFAKNNSVPLRKKGDKITHIAWSIHRKGLL